MEKKSRFIATIVPVHSEEEAAAFIERIRKQYWDARHNCYAFTIGDRHGLTRCSDDGEPPQTAGRPMLDVLLGQDVHDVCVVVTRYFGGTLLGTGGLVRAYSQAVMEGLKQCRILERMRCRRVKVRTDYALYGKVAYTAGAAAYPGLDCEYGTDVLSEWLVPEEETARFVRQLTEISSGQAEIDDTAVCEAAFDKDGYVLL